MTYHLGTLSPTQRDVLASVARFRQLTSSQIRRLHYRGTPRGCEVRANHHLRRLVALNLLTRLERVQGGYGGGSGEHVYQLPTTKARTPHTHTLDIAELYVQLVERPVDLVYDPEPHCYIKIGYTQLKPDAYVKLATGEWWIEIDRASEFRSQLAVKMRRYVSAFNQWDVEEDGEVFPRVLWVAPDAHRTSLIEGVIKRQAYPDLHEVVLYEQAIERMTRG